MNQSEILSIEHLTVGFPQKRRLPGVGRGRRHNGDDDIQPVVRDLSVGLRAGEIVAVVGASGSGKSLLAESILGVHSPRAYAVGDISYRGRSLDAAGLADLAGSTIGYIPQSVDSLDPLMKIGRQVMGGRPKRRSQARTRNTAATRRHEMLDLFERYGLPADTVGKYPYEISGGMARRVLIVAALLDHPEIIVADEPTPGLDAALANLVMRDLRTFADAGHAVLLITHDVELVLRWANRICVLNGGVLVETGEVADWASWVDRDRLRGAGEDEPDARRGSGPRHPYSRALLRALPGRDFEPREEE